MDRLSASRTRRRASRALLSIVIALAISGCSFATDPVEEPPPGPFYIQDATGRRWDFTYAIVHYEFDLSHFGTSKGPYARPPITDPVMVSPGDRSYPPEDATLQVLAVDFGGERRAYGIADIIRNEVLDDGFGDVHLAVAY
ncbi:MAG: hypothetical protein V3V49_06105 [Candidatus Krumholzibacteria bacterium]